MHTTQASQGTVFHHNGDYSGSVKIQVPEEPAKHTFGSQTCWVTEVPFEDIRELVLDYLRSKLIARLESVEGDELEYELTAIDQPAR